MLFKVCLFYTLARKTNFYLITSFCSYKINPFWTYIQWVIILAYISNYDLRLTYINISVYSEFNWKCSSSQHMMSDKSWLMTNWSVLSTNKLNDSHMLKTKVTKLNIVSFHNKEIFYHREIQTDYRTHNNYPLLEKLNEK